MKSRIIWLDIFKAFGIILMIMGHIGYGGIFDKFIHAFHMPMFFVASGYLWKSPNISFKKFINKKIKSLLIPYLFFGIVHYVIYMVINRENSFLQPLYHMFFINTDGMPIAGALWFLTALFITYFIYYFIDKFVKKIYIKNILIIILSLFGCLATRILNFRLPFAFDAACVGIGLFHIGYLIKTNESKKYIKRILNLKFIENLVFSIFTIILIFLNGYINMREGTYSSIILFWINAIFSSLICINFSKMILKLERLIKYLKYIGENSITYVCTNQIVIIIVTKIIFKFINNIVIGKILSFFIVLIMLYLINEIFIMTRLKKFIGK